MKYLTNDDLKAYAFERFINESTQDYAATLDKLEADNIALISSYLKRRYDTAKIFDDTSPVINELVKRILCKLMLFDVVRRNSARKVPDDYKDERDWAMKLMYKLNTGKLTIDELPLLSQEEGGTGTSSEIVWGNNKNEGFYI